jgi:serine/threonine-protein kinase
VALSNRGDARGEERDPSDPPTMEPGRLRILAEAHRAGLIHRDIKPANVILCERGGLSDFAKVVDFGLVKDVSGGAPNATSAGNVITGTPLYMSPESIVSPESIDARSDLYAVGAVAYFLLTGAPVFEAKTILEVCARHLHGEVVPPSKRIARPIVPELEALVLACLEKQPDRRPASAGALLDALLAIDAPGWTPRDADLWWSEHRDALRSRRSGLRSVSPFGQTVGIDLARRDTAA